MNLFFTDHWYDRYQYLSQCSEGHPFKRMVKGEEKSFIDPVELIKFLRTSEDAKYMWSDSEDFAVLSDMYQIKIKIITTKGTRDNQPTENWVYPDQNMAKFAELRNVDLGEMVILHEDDQHFNLIVDSDSELATVGSLSYRFNIGPIVKEEEVTKGTSDLEKEDVNEDEEHIDEIGHLRKEIKKIKEGKRILENEYTKCEKELRMKTEENVKLKIEINDLKQILKLGKELEEND